MKRIILVLSAVLLLLITGCALSDAGFLTAPKMEKGKLTVIEETEGETDADRARMNEAISAYLEENVAYKSIGGKVFEAHELYGISSKGGKITIYMWSRAQEYAVENGKLFEGSGFSMPLVIELKKNEDGGFEVLGYEAPRDGEGYIPSIKNMFPAEYQDKVLTRANVKELERIVRQKALNYFNLGGDQTNDEGYVDPVSGTDEEKDAEEEIRDGQLMTDSGTYVGRIDMNSIEILISGAPPEKAARAFRLTEALRERFDDLGLREGEKVVFSYYINGYDQLVLTEIKSDSGK